MDPGTYTLVLELQRGTSIDFGGAGVRDLEAGFYTYTGSAFGPGGLSRVDRHRAVAAGDNPTRHWHIDHLLGSGAVSIVDVWLGPGLDAECEIADQIDGEPVSGLGASDCDCESHVHYDPEREPLQESLESAYD